jgi:hypothetical protein
MNPPTKAQIRQMDSLSKLTGLALESRLATLRKISLARDATHAALAALNAPRPEPEGEIALSALARSNLLYDQWAERQRRELNLKLARQTAEWMEERAVAATAFGRNEVLNQLTDDMRVKLAKLPPKP